MSAIAGIYDAKDPIPKIYENLMMHALRKFPANDILTWRKENVFLGCLSQWITPESIGEQIPFYDEERRLAITADAMIDNREELCDQLGIEREKRKGIPDSQLILLAYSKWGDDVPSYLLGDFAFMIWDERRQKLFGARDFSGARSLYYCYDGKQLAFCTLMEPLLKLPNVKRHLNEAWLAEYLAISNMIDAVDVSQTVIKDIKQVPPSHTLSIVRGKLTIAKYHVIEMNKTIRFKRDEDYIEAFRDIFQKAVDANLRTFKSVGSQLSGGLDSGSVVSFAARTLEKQQKKLHTYSSIPAKDFNDYTDDFYYPDERPFIKAAVDYIGNIEDHYIRAEGRNSYTDIDEWLEIIESPYKAFENSFWIKGIFEAASKKGIGILLSGARGNFTISWGPAFDYYAHLLKSLRWIRFAHELKRYSRNIGVGRKQLLEPISKMAFPFLDEKSEGYRYPLLINQAFAAKTNVFEKLESYGLDANGFRKRPIQRHKDYLLDQNFIWNTNGTIFTKLSVQYGLLLRDPTNDLRVVNYCKSVPLEQFIKNGFDRALIRNATEGYLPDKVRLNQLYKGVQGMDWVHRMTANWTDLIQETEDLLKNKDIFQYVNKQSIKDALSKAKEGPKADLALDPQLRVLMRGIIVYRFLRSFEGGDTSENEMENSNIANFRCERNNGRR